MTPSLRPYKELYETSEQRKKAQLAALLSSPEYNAAVAVVMDGINDCVDRGCSGFEAKFKVRNGKFVGHPIDIVLLRNHLNDLFTLSGYVVTGFKARSAGMSYRIFGKEDHDNYDLLFYIDLLAKPAGDEP